MAIKKNILNQFASYNTIFTLSCLTPDEVNVPNETYRAGEPEHVILRSGGGATNKTTTAYEQAIGGKVEYYIDDVIVEGIVTPSKTTRNTNATFLSFQVIEPYSMGLFLQTCQLAAQEAGFLNYIQAPFMLTLEFIGYDDNGKIVQDENATKLRRNFPIRFTNVEFDVTQSGSRYFIEGIPWNEQAFIDQTEASGYDVSIEGSTVAELLQSGPKSLTTMLNGRAEELRQEGKVESTDEFVITFPTDISSVNTGVASARTQNTATVAPKKSSGGGGSSLFGNIVKGVAAVGVLGALKNNNANQVFGAITGFLGAQAPQGLDKFLSAVTGLIMTKNPITEKLSNFVQNGNLNIFGDNKIILNLNEAGNKPQGVSVVNYDRENKVYKRAPVTVSPDTRTFTFSQGTKITKMIEEVVLTSQWAQNLQNAKPDSNGMLDWFKIESQVFIKDSTAEEQRSGSHSKIFNYRVVPYKVHSSHFQAPTSGGINYAALENAVAKEYNYIYTGENSQIINFDIKIDTAFFTALAKDRGQNNSETSLGGANKMTTESPTVQVNKPVTPGISLTGMVQQIDVLAPSTGGAGGAGIDNNKIRTARIFQDAIINSDVDLVQLNLEIHGDPYFIADSGMGNYTSTNAGQNETEDGTMDYQRNEIDVLVNFRTPIDYDPQTGSMHFPEDTVPVDAFSGLYRVNFVENRFINGEFTQTLKLLRRRNQERDFKQSGTQDQAVKITDAAKNQQSFSPF
jgi:hypothetical protein